MVLLSRKARATLLLFLAGVQSNHAFQSPSGAMSSRSRACFGINSCRATAPSNEDNNEEKVDSTTNFFRQDARRGPLRNLLSRFPGQRKNPFKSVLMPFVITTAAALISNPQVSHANAPVMALPKAEGRDPMTEALTEHERRMTKKAQEELQAFTAKARQVQAEQGDNARLKFETEYKEAQARQAQAKKDGLVTLKQNLLAQGICPFVDIEGRRQVLEWEKGVDLGKVQGTQFHVEKEYERNNPKKSWAFKKAPNRAVVKCMVQDMNNRGIDPVEYFEGHKDKTASILDMSPQQAVAVVQKYQENLDLYGQIVPPKEGEMSAKDRMELEQQKNKGGDKAEAKRLKAEAKAKAAAEKAALKAQKAAEKAAAKQAKADEKAAKKAAAVAAAAGAGAAAAVAGSAAAVSSGVASTTADVASSMAASPSTELAETSESSMSSDGDSSIEMGGTEFETSSSVSTTEKKGGLPIVKVSAVLVAAGGGGYAVKILRDKSAAEEEERQKQLRLLMGDSFGESSEPDESSSSGPTLDTVDEDISDVTFDEEKHREVPETKKAEEPLIAPKKKRRRMFGKKKNSRETDIVELVTPGPDVKAPEFAKTLAKILTFGAPGRFPDVIALPGDMPMQSFELDSAKNTLIEAQTSAVLTKEESAEVFANVVNCMLIDIVDLASASLKEKDDKVTVDAIDIVVDFMNHAASLYDSIAEDVIITPVTYGGDLGKNKLEQMYSAYAVSGMTGGFENMAEDFQDRVDLLQDVFQINQKKAEGLMMKALQKNMMEMMKSGEGMEGMEDMMKGMAGGMPGMGMGEGEEPSPEQLKEMLLALKEMKDSGSIPPAELEEVKKQFKEAFGSGVGDVMQDADANADQLTDTDKELLDLMKSILD